MRHGEFTRLLEVASGVVMIVAGIYLLARNNAVSVGAGEQNWFEVIAHGIGIYFLGQGLWVLAQVRRRSERRPG